MTDLLDYIERWEAIIAMDHDKQIMQTNKLALDVINDIQLKTVFLEAAGTDLKALVEFGKDLSAFITEINAS